MNIKLITLNYLNNDNGKYYTQDICICLFGYIKNNRFIQPFCI